MQTWIKAIGFRIVAFGLSMLLTVFLLEVGLTLAGWTPDYHQPRIDYLMLGPDGEMRYAPCGFVPGATIRSKYDSDPRGYFDLGHVIDHTFNSAGWRDVEHDLKKPVGTFRILGLGDSYLYGQGVREGDICLHRTVQRLEEACGASIEGINTGQSGINTAVELQVLRRCGLAYDPDLVILYFVPNDVEASLTGRRPKVEFFVNYTGIYEQPDALSHWLVSWGLIRQRYLQNVRARNYLAECAESFDEQGEKWAQCRTALDGMRELCRSRDVPLLVVVFPFFCRLNGDYPFQPIHDLVRTHCESIGVPVVDLREHYREFEGRELWVHAVDPHPNEAAHRIAADAVSEFLLTHPADFRLPEPSGGR